ncbi:dolichol phosphate-mannose biosynthesis regulatory [Flagelloscypha sp. PMI_526]|nr:dolichol phosphate-mannose biosynthesis regulatory [Flagelloscypha sp. PMI_526]
MAISDKILGGTMLGTAAFVFVYYTTWALILPFFEPSSNLYNYFPAREWAIRLPAFILVVGLTAIGSFIGNTMLNESRKKQKARQRIA